MNSSRQLKELLPRPVRRRLGAARRWLRSLPPRTRAQLRQLLSSASLDEKERELLRRVESRISYNDGMYVGDGEHYFKVGLSAIACVEAALQRAGIEAPRNILDLPCGHGRVLRFLARRFPEARLSACDLDRDGVDFCARHFGARPFYSVPDFDQLDLRDRFDLIWCGSLVTHLDAPATRALLRFFARRLAPAGLIVFTAHGQFVAERMPKWEFDYGLKPEQVNEITDAYAREGFAYTDYPYRPDYGVSLTSPEWLRAQARREAGTLREVYFDARGWDRHQDVYGFVNGDCGF